jgi:hypothetical protein
LSARSQEPEREEKETELGEKSTDKKKRRGKGSSEREKHKQRNGLERHRETEVLEMKEKDIKRESTYLQQLIHIEPNISVCQSGIENLEVCVVNKLKNKRRGL